MEETMDFKSAKEFEAWLSKNHTVSKGAWLRMYRKDAGGVHLKGAEALDVALCYGWITGQARSDKISALWRFCPRRPKSIWSKLNTGHAERLIKEGRMKPAGIKQIEEAKQDGRWERAYSSPKMAKLPDDFLREVKKSKKAERFLKTLKKTNTYAIIFRLETTKSEKTRKKKIKIIIEMLKKGEVFH